MGKIYKNGILFAGSTENARSVAFDNADTGLEAANVQEAIEEIKSDVAEINSNLEWKLIETIIGTNSNDVRNVELAKYKEILIVFTYNPNDGNIGQIRNFTVHIPVLCLTDELTNYSTGCYQNETTNNAFFCVKISLNEILFPSYSAYYLTNNIGQLTTVKVYAR